MKDEIPGWLPSGRAIEALAKAAGSRGPGIDALLDALRGGVISARGTPSDSVLGLPTTGSEYISPAFWRGASSEDRSKWSWSGGFFCSTTADYLAPASKAFTSVRFSTASILDLCDALAVDSSEDKAPSQTHSASPARGRRRKPEWNDWVAALAVVASDGGVHGSLTETALLDAVANKMAEWGLDEIPRSTVQQAAGVVLDRFRQGGIHS